MDERQRALRTLMQVVVSAGFAEGINQLIVDLNPSVQIVATIGLAYVVSYAQNWLEERGKIPTILKPVPAPIVIEKEVPAMPANITSIEDYRPHLGS